MKNYLEFRKQLIEQEDYKEEGMVETTFYPTCYDLYNQYLAINGYIDPMYEIDYVQYRIYCGKWV